MTERRIFRLYECIKYDDLVKSPISVIARSPANGGTTRQSHHFKHLQR